MTDPLPVREILVTGARGKTGREVVAQLAARGVRVRAGSSRPGDPSGPVRVVPFDWDDRSTWAPAVRGADAIYLMRPEVADAGDRVAEVVSKAPGTHVVLLSEQGVADLPEASWEGAVERAVTEHADSWTLLRPSWFQQMLTDPRFFLAPLRRDGVLPLTTGGAPIAFVDTRDIAAVAVAALLHPQESTGVAYEPTGPEPLTLAEVADLVGAAAGRAVAAVDVPLDDAVAGTPPWLEQVLRGLLLRVRDGVFARVTDDVQRVTGRPPGSVAQFAREHAGHWRDDLRHQEARPTTR